MRLVAQFDPSLTTSGTFNSTLNNGVGKMVIYNESNISLQFTFSDGSTAYVPAWTAVLYCVHMSGTTVDWSQLYTLSAAGPPLSIVIVEIYDAAEQVYGTFPAALVRQANIGNTVSTVGGAASSIQNDANTAGTSIVESTVAGDGASAVTLTNDALLVLGNATHHGELTVGNGPSLLINPDDAGGIDVKLSQSGKTCKVVGQLDVFQNGVFESDVFIHNSKPLHFTTGSISLISMFTAAVTTTATDFPHGLGAVPDIVFLQAVGGAITVRTCEYANDATLTSTNVRIIANASFNIVGLAIKF